MQHSVYKAPADYAAQIKAMGFTKEQMATQMLEMGLPHKYILDCMFAF